MNLCRHGRHGRAAHAEQIIWRQQFSAAFVLLLCKKIRTIYLRCRFYRCRTDERKTRERIGSCNTASTVLCTQFPAWPLAIEKTGQLNGDENSSKVCPSSWQFLAGAPLAEAFDAQSLAKQTAQLLKNALNCKEINLSSVLRWIITAMLL